MIVGGGGAGLTCSMLLSQLGINTLLVSSLPTTSILPKAHVLNQRTMEILGDVGAAERIYAKSTPAENMAAMGWYAGFAGPDPDFGRLVGKIESWGAGYTNLNWVQASACRSANLPQIRLEPIMKARAEELNPDGIRFHHELTKLEQDRDGVTAWIENRDTGAPYTVRARYLLGCDGGRTIPRMIGIPYEGLGVIAQTATAHVSADLSMFARDPDVLIRWIWCPAIGEMAVLVPMGPDHWGPDSEE
ncbi:MAG: FAD-dependent monooxygenase, partial [Acetobacteraceae bacterium]|nr:FAD-dependent monooxygenase [Acetobacteraceae bacterium]